MFSPHNQLHTQLHRAISSANPKARASQVGALRQKIAIMDSAKPIVAVLYQALPPPIYGGVSKPPKPGGKVTQSILRISCPR